jgi:hypothetical protein
MTGSSDTSRPSVDELSHIAHILNKWDLLRNPLATELVTRAFTDLAKAGGDFLDAVFDFEARTSETLRDKSTPPHVYFETVEALQRKMDCDIKRMQLDAILEIEKIKSVVTIQIIEGFQDFFIAQQTPAHVSAAWGNANQEACEKECLSKAMHITGTIVRQVINHLMDTHHAEINFCKNPWIRAGIAMRSKPAIRAYYHSRVA